MQIPQSVHTGDVLEIRRHRWRVLDVTAYERCQLLTVSGVDPGNSGIERRFLMPFDTVAPLDRRQSLRFVRPRRWRSACRALMAEGAPPGGLRTARLARIDLLPHQLEPALAVIGGRGSRLLLADDVGLGKTVQAGLIVAELRGRGLADRVLVATPAGLRDQWRAELSDRFGIAATIVDFREIRRRSAQRAVGLNPWITTPIAIASIDYLKRPEILQSVRSCRWDVMVVDEAHGAGAASDRHAAVSALASHAGYVLLLTATPHSGDPRAFASLCGVGAHDDPVLVFRRTRRDVHLGAGRRVHRLHVRTSAAEARVHVLLAEFTRAIRAEHDGAEAWIALSVLHKRAFSSARSLELTVSRRLATLGDEVDGGVRWGLAARGESLAAFDGRSIPANCVAPRSNTPGILGRRALPAGRLARLGATPDFHHGLLALEQARQLALPLTDRLGELDESDEAPDCLAGLGLGDERRERRMLRAMRDAAREAAADETKMSAIRRLLRRVAEPVVVFTEFRDTLLHLRAALNQPAVMLHGGMTRDERTLALNDFATGRRDVLLATDAAGEGLNLHHRCRIVVNLELPWNPMRLEQRIGRVDRIGQRRTVHAFHFIAGDTGESRVLERLKVRIARAQEDIASANPLEDERAVARTVIDPHGLDRRDDEAAVRAHAPRPASEWSTVALQDEANAEVARLALARSLSHDADAGALAALESTGPWLTRARLSATRIRLQHRAIALLRIDYEDAVGRLADRLLVPLSIPLPRREPFDLEWTMAFLHFVWADLQRCAEGASHRRRAVADGLIDQLVSTRLAREQRIARAILAAPSDRLQPGLFDRRAERTHVSDRNAWRESSDEFTRHIHLLAQRGVISPRPARLLLVLVP